MTLFYILLFYFSLNFLCLIVAFKWRECSIIAYSITMIFLGSLVFVSFFTCIVGATAVAFYRRKGVE